MHEANLFTYGCAVGAHFSGRHIRLSEHLKLLRTIGYDLSTERGVASHIRATFHAVKDEFGAKEAQIVADCFVDAKGRHPYDLEAGPVADPAYSDG
jgi:hypothetical protein